jgi:hypothetical protein
MCSILLLIPGQTAVKRDNVRGYFAYTRITIRAASLAYLGLDPDEVTAIAAGFSGYCVSIGCWIRVQD